MNNDNIDTFIEQMELVENIWCNSICIKKISCERNILNNGCTIAFALLVKNMFNKASRVGKGSYIINK